jgi:hypothetical protein
MAIVFTITHGATTIDLNSAACAVTSDGYAPRPSESFLGPTITTESFDVHLFGTAAAISALIQSIEGAFWQAKNYQNTGAGARVYANLQPDNFPTAYRSELLDGRVILEDAALIWMERSNYARARIAWTRRNWWEGPEAQLPLSNTNATDDLTGLVVYNANDGAGAPPADRVNYVEIDGADVAGDLPAPVRLELTNTYAGESLGWLWIGHGTQSPTNLLTRLEAEAALGKGPGTAHAASSGGYYVQEALPSGVIYSYTWTLTAAQLTAAAGRWFHALVRCTIGPSVHFRFQLKLQAANQTIWESGWAALDGRYAHAIRDLFTLRLPPWLAGLGGLSALDLVLEVVQSAQPSLDLYLDCLYLLPAEHWQFLGRGGVTISQNRRVVVDGIEERTYCDDGAGAARIGLPNPAGTPILLEPGKTQRLYFLMHASAYTTAEIARTLSVKAFYRPRRLSL